LKKTLLESAKNCAANSTQKLFLYDLFHKMSLNYVSTIAQSVTSVARRMLH